MIFNMISPSPTPVLTEHARFLAQPLAVHMRTPGAGGQPIILAPRLPPPGVVTSQHSGHAGLPPLVSPSGEAPSLMYNPYTVTSMNHPTVSAPMQHTASDPYGLGAAQPSIFEYTNMDPTQAGMLFRRDCITGM